MATTQRVKKLKVMQSNGQFGNPIPLGTDAKYVDLENGRTVESEFAHRNNLIVDYYSELPTSGIEEGEIGYVRNDEVIINRVAEEDLSSEEYYFMYIDFDKMKKIDIPENDFFTESVELSNGDWSSTIWFMQGTNAAQNLNDNLFITIIPMKSNFTYIYSFKTQVITGPNNVSWNCDIGWYAVDKTNWTITIAEESQIPNLSYGRIRSNASYDDGSVLYNFVYLSAEEIDIHNCNYKGHYVYENGEWKYDEAWVEVIEDIDNILVRLDTGEGVI